MIRFLYAKKYLETAARVCLWIWAARGRGGHGLTADGALFFGLAGAVLLLLLLHRIRRTILRYLRRRSR